MGYKDPNKQRFLTVLEGGIPDRVPNYEVLIMSRVASAILGREVPHTLSGDLSAQDYIELVHLVGQDLIGLNFFGYPYMHAGADGVPRQPEILTRGGTVTREQVAAMMGPDRVLELQIKGLLGPKLEAYARAVEGTDVGLFVLTGMLMQSIYQFIVGFEDFMVMLHTDRGFIEELLDASAEFHRRIVEFVCQYPIDLLYMADDVAFKSGLMIKPELFLDLWEERMRYAIEPAREQGIPMIFHSDGTIYDIIDAIIDLGFLALNPIEPYGMDIYAVKERWGDRIALMGNIDVAGPLAFGTPEDVAADTREHLERLMPGGRYILASSHSIMDNVSPENYLAMIETVHQYGRYA